jgi:nuclear transport factor 2 (NTF2) superfamily protein
MSLRWRIYYRDRTTINSSQSTWEQAADHNIVAVVWAYNDGPISVEVGTPYYMSCGDWIARVWDCTLYLRKHGVKFGRWARFDVFQQAWRCAIIHMFGSDAGISTKTMLSSITGHMDAAKATDKKSEWVAWYDDGKVYSGQSYEDWCLLPTDGILSVCYSYVLNDIRIAIAQRRYTYYYWKHGELINTDHLDTLLKDFPMFKTGCPAFTGNSYLAQAHAIADAMADTLEDVL